MKYIKERKLFISNPRQPLINPELINQESNLINEIVGNDIRFGGTWFGRLINSTIRKATNAYKGTQIQSLVTKVRDQLYTMLDENMSGELKNEYGYYLYHLAMSNVDEMVKNEDIDFEEKKVQLIGKDGNGGLVQAAIDALTELNLKDKPGDYQYKIDNRDFILKQLRDFAQKLKNMKNPKEEVREEVKEEESKEEPKNPNKPIKELPYNGPSASQVNNQSTVNDDEKKKIEDQINSIKTIINSQKEALKNANTPVLKKQIEDDIKKKEEEILDLNKN